LITRGDVEPGPGHAACRPCADHVGVLGSWRTGTALPWASRTCGPAGLRNLSVEVRAAAETGGCAGTARRGPAGLVASPRRRVNFIDPQCFAEPFDGVQGDSWATPNPTTNLRHQMTALLNADRSVPAGMA